MFDLLVAGEINPDLILSGDVLPEFGQAEKIVASAELTIGSSSAIFACGAARLGLKVAFIGRCGRDPFGRFMLDALHSRGIDVSEVLVDPEGQTGVSVILNRGTDRAILTHPGLIPSLRAADVPDRILVRSRHLHVASYYLQTALQPGLPGLFQRARAAGLTISLDPNYDPAGRWEGVERLLPSVDIFLPNQGEALSLTRESSLERAADRLAAGGTTLVVKLGPEGALAVSKGETRRVASIPVDVVDAVGAGDSFDAGFVFGFLQGWPLERSLRLACICGALSTRAAGGTRGQPTLEEALGYDPG